MGRVWWILLPITYLLPELELLKYIALKSKSNYNLTSHHHIILEDYISVTFLRRSRSVIDPTGN